VNKLTLALPLLFVSSTALADPAPAIAAPAPMAPVFEPADASPAPATTPAADEPATLVGSRGLIKHSGWYVAPSIGATTLDGHLSSLVGLRGGWLVNRQFGIGLTGSAFGWDSTHLDTPRANTRVDGGYGGLLLQYIIGSDKLVHGSIETTIGGGALCYDAASSRRDCNDAITFFVFEPAANVELNVTSFMRIGVGGGYRFTAVDDSSLSSKPELRGFVARTNIQFGQF
jgi:hypothetical protein